MTKRIPPRKFTCEMCGKKYIKTGRATNRTKYCGSWRDREGCSYLWYVYRLNTNRGATTMETFLADKHPEIIKEYWRFVSLLPSINPNQP